MSTITKFIPQANAKYGKVLDFIFLSSLEWNKFWDVIVQTMA